MEQLIIEVRALQIAMAVMQAQLALIISWLGGLTMSLVLIAAGAVSTMLFRRNGKG